MDLTKEHVGRVDIEKIVGMKIKRRENNKFSGGNNVFAGSSRKFFLGKRREEEISRRKGSKNKTTIPMEAGINSMWKTSSPYECTAHVLGT